MDKPTGRDRLSVDWKRSPPKFGKRNYSLNDLVSDFKQRRRDPQSLFVRDRDNILGYCEEQPTLQQAIKVACASLRPNGKMHNHQCKVPASAKAGLAKRLIQRRLRLRRCRSFSDLLAEVEDAGSRVRGSGPVFAYDVATRVGAYLGLEPELVYLHAGCEQGARALGLPIGVDLQQADLPKPLRRLTPDETEDFLCGYRVVLITCREAERNGRDKLSLTAQ